MVIMFIGACLLTGAYGPTDQVFLSVFCFSLFFYAVGKHLGLPQVPLVGKRIRAYVPGRTQSPLPSRPLSYCRPLVCFRRGRRVPPGRQLSGGACGG